MNGNIAGKPLARALLRYLADNRDHGDPIGSLARTVVSDEATLLAAANNPWHGQGSAEARQEAIKDLSRIPPERLARFERAGPAFADWRYRRPEHRPVNALTRWRLARPFIGLSGLFLFATAVGAWAYWSEWSLAERLITILTGVMFALTLAVSISIGADRRINNVPWFRMGVVVVFFALACGVILARDTLR